MENKKYFHIRIDPKFGYMLEVLGRVNNTDKTKIIKSAVQFAFNKDETAQEVFNETWDFDRKKRLKKLAQYDKSLLTYEESLELGDK